MNNKERYNQIIDAAYENYSKEYEKDNSIGLCLLVKRLDGKSTYIKPDKEGFITMCEFDEMFSEIWGLKIEERDLSLGERKDIWNKNNIFVDMSWHNMREDYCIELLNEDNIPTKLITLTYNDESIESYE